MTPSTKGPQLRATPISAQAFWNAFKPAVLKAKPTGCGREWTAGMYRVLHLVQAKLGDLSCQCRFHDKPTEGRSGGEPEHFQIPLDAGFDDKPTQGRPGERLAIDFMWFPTTLNLETAKGDDEEDEHEHAMAKEDEYEWIPPLVAIEHENLWHPSARSVDHWKVSQVSAPLRVFIGYTEHGHEVEPAAKRLRAREPRWYPVEGGQAMIILGHGQMNDTDFRAWWAHQGIDHWRELTWND